MTLHEAFGKYVRATLDTGQVFEGKVVDYTPDYDNTPEITSISISVYGHKGVMYELYENQIISIEEI